MALHPHLIVQNNGETSRFTSPSTGPRERINLPPRERAAHAQALIEQLEEIQPQAAARAEQQRALGLDAGLGVYLRFDSEPNFPLKFESLDLTNSGIQLCNVRTLADNTMQATVFVPETRLALFLKRVAAYQDEDTTPRTEGGAVRPKNQALVESISNIQLAALEALWTEETLPFPDHAAAITWELWLRRERDIDHLARLRGYAEHFNLHIGEQVLTFADRIVVLARGTANDLARSVDILGMLAEVRLPKVTAAFFTEMTSVEQREWVVNSPPALCRQLPATHPVFASLIPVSIKDMLFSRMSLAPLTCTPTSPLGMSTTATAMERRWPGSRRLGI